MTDAGPTSEPPFDAGALRVAYHEAGHATVARLLDIDIATVTVIAADGALGHVKHNGLADYASLASDPDALMTQIAFERTAMMFLAGCMAERIYLAVSDGELEGYEGALEDLHGATSLIESLTQDGSEELLEAWLHLLDLRVGRLLRTNWSAVQRVAICAVLLVILPVLEGRPLIAGLDLAGESLGFAALVFVLTFWVIPGSPAERRSARQEAYAALLYVLAALDALVFHIVL